MTNSLPNPWWQLMVGHQWPSSDSLALLKLSANQRAAKSAEFEEYADSLSGALTSSLSVQQGFGAEAAQSVFRQGIQQAQLLAEKYLAKSQSFESAHAFANALQLSLRDIAARGETEIRAIQSSNAPGPFKLNQVVNTIVAAQLEANAKAATAATNLYSEIQQMITQNSFEISAREFAAANGCDLTNAWGTNDIDSTRERVLALDNSLTPDSPTVQVEPDHAQANSQTSAAAITANGSAGSSMKPRPEGADAAGSATRSTLHDVANGATTAGNGRQSPIPASGLSPIESQQSGGVAKPLWSTADVIQNGSNVTSSSSSFDSSIVTPSGGAFAEGGIPSPRGISPLSSNIHSSSFTEAVPTPITPTDLAHGFNAGSQAAAPISAGTEAVSANGVHSAHQTPTHNPPMPAPAVAPVAPMAIGPEVAVAHAPSEAAPPTVLAAPQPTVQAAAPAPPSISVTPSAAPAGALPTYGADLKAPAATIPAASPAPAAPTSAHLSGSATNTLSQPSVVRHQSAPSAATTATALTERAVAATTTGAIGGAATSQATAQQRLRHLLAFVARQAPELGWTIGERDSGITLLTTDLASGWIPPNIQIPSGVTILEPAKRSGSLAGMLGATILTASHAPGQHVPLDNADAPTISTRPRTTADVEDLHWKLAQATKWRDGLPRLAHTLARAISSGTGYLNSEVQLLQDALHSVANRAVATYPNTEPDLIGNWQLLATIEALINNETNCANYHLAWFRALAPTGVSSR